jgi:hypothetical protein
MTGLRREANGEHSTKDAWDAEQLLRLLKERPEVGGGARGPAAPWGRGQAALHVSEAAGRTPGRRVGGLFG